jgi:hypothetical protein
MSNMSPRAMRIQVEKEARVAKLAHDAAVKLTALGVKVIAYEEGVGFASGRATQAETEELTRELAEDRKMDRRVLHEALCRFDDDSEVVSTLAALVAAHAGYIVSPPPVPSPTKTDGPSIWDEVIADLEEGRGKSFHFGVEDLVAVDMRGRDIVGRERYGTKLQANNGRDALRDAYEEGLDRTVYKRQALDEIMGETVSFARIIELSDAYARARDPSDPTFATMSSRELDQANRARAYLASLTAVVQDREEIERRNDARRGKP